ncbi:GDSL-type esterase/lipase family protein [Streptomyces sp. 900105755]
MRKFVAVLAGLFAMIAAGAYPTSAAEVSPTATVPDTHWVGSWEGAPEQNTASIPAMMGAQQSYRMLVHTAFGGSVARVRFSNAYGTGPVTFADVHAGLPVGGVPDRALRDGTNQPVTFAGNRAVTVAAGQDVVSDPLPLSVPADGYVAISFYLPVQPAAPTVHTVAMTTSYMTPAGSGDHASDTGPAAFALPVASWYFVTGLDVLAPVGVHTVVALGDSITDCCDEIPDTDTRWPDFLNHRLQAADLPRVVVNAGISGNEVSEDRGGDATQGAAATIRLPRDVLGEPDVHTVILFEGINDVGVGAAASKIIDAYMNIASQLHDHRIRVLIATLTPCSGSVASGTGYITHCGTRDAVNTWIRTQHVFDGVIDFATAVANSADPELWNPAYNSGDQLHPNVLGLQRLADTVDLARLY